MTHHDIVEKLDGRIVVHSDVYAVDVNRADSGSPVWRTLYFFTQESAEKQRDGEVPENVKGQVSLAYLWKDIGTGEYYLHINGQEFKKVHVSN